MFYLGNGNTFDTFNFRAYGDVKEAPPKVPEAQGLIWGLCLIVVYIAFFLIIFLTHETGRLSVTGLPYTVAIDYLAVCLSVVMMILLGFVDDVLDIRWLYKLIFPLLPSLVLLVVYYMNGGSTTVLVPIPFRTWFGIYVNIGIFYYCYIVMLIVFCTNSINIYSGVNGIEVGQCIVIGLSLIVFNIIEFNHGDYAGQHTLSLFLMVPFVVLSMALYSLNRYPAKVFVGDTYCYSAGMTLAVVGIVGHFSKTLLLFFAPQILNFLYSVPQLFKLIPCPRHRLPRFNATLQKLEPRTVEFKLSSLSRLGRLCFWWIRTLRLANIELQERQGDDQWVVMNNLTLINLGLLLLGPQHERRLAQTVIAFQVFCSCVAFTIRYPLSWCFYDN